MYSKIFDSQSIDTTRQLITQAQNIVLLSHMNADGDACGSILGFTLLLEQAAPQAHSVVPILPNGCPKYFQWLPSSDRILSGEKEREQCTQLIEQADLIICVDLNTPSRVDFLQDALTEAQGHKILIDHHHNPDTAHFDIIYSDPQISSTCELELWLSDALWERKYMNTDVARCLYTGLRTDTGGFAFSCSQPSCFEAAAQLVSYDIQPAEVHNMITNTFTVNRMIFYGFAISQRLEIFPARRVALFAFSLEDQHRYNVSGEDMEGLVNYTLMMQDIEVGALLREEQGRTKISLRAKYDVNVNHLAQQLGGGGHTKAAGATYPMALSETLTVVKRLLGIDDEEPLKTILTT